MVGLLEGNQGPGVATGLYRSQFACIMYNSSNPTFCKKCREEIVLRMYKLKWSGRPGPPKILRPIKSASPATSSLTLNSGQSATLSLNLVQPATHSLTVQWYVNGILQAGTLPSFTFQQQGTAASTIV